MMKDTVPQELLQRAVVDDLEPLSASKEVLATSFDNLLRFPNLVSLAELRALKDRQIFRLRLQFRAGN